MKPPQTTAFRLSSVKGLKPGIHRMRVNVEGLERRYVVHIPQSHDGRTPLPIVMIFHGGGGTAATMMRMTAWVDKSEQAGFLAAFLEGMSLDPTRPARFVDNPQFWNDGTGREHVGRRNIDDVGFVEACLDDLVSRFPVDEGQLFATGFSNGAFMVSRLGLELAHRFVAIAPVAGIYLTEDASPSPSVSVLCIVGTEDPLSPLHGGEVRWPWGGKESQPAVFDSIEKWAQMAGCDARPRIVVQGDGVRAVAYGPRTGQAEVVLYTVEGMGHTWPGARISLPERVFGKSTDKIRACDVIWDFFQQHKRQTDR